MPTASFAARVGSAVQKAAGHRQLTWYTPFMAAAARAIAERIPLVDFVLDVRDARIPLSSECEQLRRSSSSSHCIIVLNKMDLANRSHTKEWIRYFERENHIACATNSHNKDDIKEFLKFLQGQVRAWKNEDLERQTITMMLVGIPNVGKSTLANSLHQIGRISAAEKGKLKHAVVNALPGETKGVSSLKIASHPNIYVLDTPGILPPQIADIEVCSKLALTGALTDSLAGEEVLSQCFLAVLNSSFEHKKWVKLCTEEEDNSSLDDKVERLGNSELSTTRKRRYSTDHTQDFIVHDVRRSLSEAVSSFKGNLEDENDMQRLIEVQLGALKEAFRLPMNSDDNSHHKVAVKLLNLYRTGRLGHYTLDPLPSNLPS
ncbi:hypothetical protein Ancab_037290 [Ancistrocladus abbreviatus]